MSMDMTEIIGKVVRDMDTAQGMIVTVTKKHMEAVGDEKQAAVILSRQASFGCFISFQFWLER